MGGDVEMSMMRRRAWRLGRASGDGTGTEITYGEHTKGHPKGHRVSRVSEPLIESMLFLSFAYKMGSGAGRSHAPQVSRTSGALLHRLVVTLILALSVEPSSAVCPHCNNFFPGCEGGDTCPLVQDLRGNVEVFKSNNLGTVPKLGHLLPANIQNLFPRRTVEILQDTHGW